MPEMILKENFQNLLNEIRNTLRKDILKHD